MEKFFVATGGILLVTFFVLIGMMAYRRHMKCLDGGGHWARENCHLVQRQTCTTQDFGNGVILTQCFPTTETECDSVCRGARAEQ